MFARLVTCETSGVILSVRKWFPWLVLLAVLHIRNAGAHLPHSMDEFTARQLLDDLTVAIGHEETEFSRQLHLKGDIAELELRRAQEELFRQKPERAASRLLALTFAPAFEKHRSRAAVYRWLGQSFREMGFVSSARAYLIQSYFEPRQTNAARLETVQQLLALRTTLEAELSRSLWRNAVRLADATKTELRPYPYCRALYRSGLLADAANCFREIKSQPYDRARAHYFRAVIDLRDRRYTEARVQLLSTLGIVATHRKPLPLDGARSASMNDGAALSTHHIQVPEDEDPRWDDLFARTHLALARLAAAQEKWLLASEHYQYVPPGHPTFFDATREWALVTDRTGAPRRSAAILISVGQSTTPNAPGLKQAIWRAELLGRGAAFNDASAAYSEVQKQTENTLQMLQPSAVTPQTTAQRAMWLMPDNGDQYQSLTATIEALEKELDRLGKAYQFLHSHTAKLPSRTSPRKTRLDKLAVRLRILKEGITTRKLPTTLLRQVNLLEGRMATLQTQDSALLNYHRKVLPTHLSALHAQLIDSVDDMGDARRLHRGLQRSIGVATKNLLATLETQTGLSHLNILVWRKEAVAAERKKAIEDKRLMMNWIEDDDPGRAPAIR